MRCPRPPLKKKEESGFKFCFVFAKGVKCIHTFRTPYLLAMSCVLSAKIGMFILPRPPCFLGMLIQAKVRNNLGVLLDLAPAIRGMIGVRPPAADKKLSPKCKPAGN